MVPLKSIVLVEMKQLDLAKHAERQRKAHTSTRRQMKETNGIDQQNHMIGWLRDETVGLVVRLRDKTVGLLTRRGKTIQG